MKQREIKLDANRFNSICEYSKVLSESGRNPKMLLEFGEDNQPEETEGSASPEEGDVPPTDNQEGGEAPTDNQEAPFGDENQEAPTENEPNIAEPMPGEGEEPMPGEGMPMEDDAVEVDITDMVSADQEIKSSIDRIAAQISQVLKTVEDLNQKTQQIEQQTNSKIDELGQEVVKRNPTTVEKQEMVSLKAPYTYRVGDVFTPNEEGSVDMTMNQDKPEVAIETETTPDYNESEVKQSLSPQYKEEEIPWKF